MKRIAPDQEWWTATDLAASGLPDLPNTRQGVDALAARQDWRAQPGLSRRRQGRGGGWEYSWKLLPVRTQAALLKDKTSAPEASPRMDRGEAWAWFDGLPEEVKQKARDRLLIVQQVEGLAEPMGKNLAVETVARDAGISARSVWDWFGMVEGADAADRLPYLAPRHRVAAPSRQRAQCSPEFLDRLKAAYMRPGPSFRASYDDVVDVCRARGWACLTEVSARRWFDKNVPYVSLVYAREGEAGLARCFPPQIRDRSGLTALEGVNADCHKIDVFVQWPGIEKPVRPQVVMFQDLFSNKMLAWRVDLDPNKVAVMSAFGELIETYGIPRHCLFDNGHEFANKWLTGGTPTRFRFKVREDDPLGVLPQMGIKIHWATPAHGQAKPIERGFRDFADRIARDPRFAGAYVGPNPMAKPEDYGSRAIPLADFLAVLEEGIRKHNARPGRQSDNAKGRSFDETFAESYAKAPIRKATVEQHRLWLMGQEVRKLHRTHGELRLHKNRYWADWMNEHAGEKIVARFDPEDLHAGVFIYSLAGEFLGPADCREKVGFFDLVGAQLHARVNRQRRQAEKKLLEVLRPMSVGDLAAEMNALAKPETPLIEAKVVELAPARIRKPLIERSLPAPDTSRDSELTVLQVDFAAVRPEVSTVDPEITRFWRMLDIETRMSAGDDIPAADAEFWGRMKDHPVYLAQRDLYDRHGAQAIG